MTIMIIFIIGLFFLLAGWAFFYEPGWIVRLNKIMRDKVFNDSYALLERKKKAVVFILISFIFFFWAYQRAQYGSGRLSEKLISNDMLLYQSLRHLESKEYGKAIALCDHVLTRNPDNAEALYQIGAARFLLNDPAAGNQYWAKAAKIEPNCPVLVHLQKMISKVNVSSETAAGPK